MDIFDRRTPARLSVLIEYGKVTIEVPRADGRAPLLCILEKAEERAMLEFLEYGPDCSATDNKGDGALHILVQRKGDLAPSIFPALFQGDADPKPEKKRRINSCSR